MTEANFTSVLTALNFTSEAAKAQMHKDLKKGKGTLPFAEFLVSLKSNQATYPVKSFDDSDLIKTPAQKIIAMLKQIKQMHIQQGASKDIVAQLTYSIDKISSRQIYEIDQPFLDSLDLHESRNSVTKGWIHEYSSMRLDILRDISLQNSL